MGVKRHGGWVVLTWGPFSVAIELMMATDVTLVVKNGLNGVIVSNCGWWGRWGNLPGLVDDSGGGWQWWQCAGCSGNATGVVGGSKAMMWQRWN